MDKPIKLIATSILGVICAIKKEYGLLISLVFYAISIDVITGIIKGKINHELNSKAGTKGFLKKVALLIAFSFGFLLDFLVIYLAEFFSVKIPESLSFGSLMGIYISINECISICENLDQCGVKLPPFILNTLKIADKKINSASMQKTNDAVNDNEKHDKKGDV